MSSPPAPDGANSRVFSYADEPQSPEGQPEVAADHFFDDDLVLDAEALGGAPDPHYAGLLQAPAPQAVIGDEQEEDQQMARVRAATIQRTVELLGDFAIGGGDDDDRDEDEPMSPRDEELYQPRGLQVAEAEPPSPIEFHSNPLAMGGGSGSSFGAAFQLADEDDLEGNAIGDLGFAALQTPSRSPQHHHAHEPSESDFRVLIDPSVAEGSPPTSPAYNYAANAIGAAVSSSPLPPLRAVAPSRVFSYEDGFSDASASPSPEMPIASPSNVVTHGTASKRHPHLRLDVPARENNEVAVAVDDLSPSANFTPVRFQKAAGGAVARHRAASAADVDSYLGGDETPSPHPMAKASLQVPTAMPRIHRPSITSLAPDTIHNRLSVADGAGAGGAPKRGQRLPQLTPADLNHIPAENRGPIEELLAVADVRPPLSFPYPLEDRAGKDPYESLGSFPTVDNDPRVAAFVEPEVGIVTSIKGEEVRPVMLSDAVYDSVLVPTRFTRPQRRREFHPSTQIKGLAALVAQARRPVRHENVQCLVLFNEKSVSLKQEVADCIQKLVYLETIQLQECKVKKWTKPLTLPRLLNLDARRCQIKDISIIQNICLNSPYLYSLTIAENPISDQFVDPATKKQILPPVDHAIWKQLLLRLPSLEYFNLVPIDNATRQRAYLYTRSKKLYPMVASTLWHMSLNNAAAVQAMQTSGGWQSSAIVELNLSGQSLLTCNLGSIQHSIERLNLAGNRISTLVGSGLHLCKSLRSLNLAQNALTNIDEVYMFGHLPLLRALWIAGNPIEQHASVVVYATRHLRGTNRAPGLQELDGRPISLEQRIVAYEKNAPNGKAQAAKERWRLLLAQHFGHTQLVQVPGLFTHFTHWDSLDTTFADVSAFTGLVALNLRGNRLKTVIGLEKLTSLRYLDLRYNPDLQHKLVVAQVQQLHATIEWVSIAHSEEEMNDFTGLRLKFLLALVPSCHRLAVLDQRRILAEEYVKVFAKSRGFDKSHPKRVEYMLHVSLVMHNASAADRRFDFDSCQPNLQYTFDNVHTLNLSGLRVTDSFVVPPLPNLTLLNVSHNKLTSFRPLGLGRFTKLLFLDVRHNKIKCTAMEAAVAIGVCMKLFGFAMAGNPGYTAKFRAKLIAAIPELASLDCNLRVIDDAISVDERVAAWGVASHLLGGEEEGVTPASPMSPRSPTTSAATPASSATPHHQPRAKRGSIFVHSLPDPSADPQLYQRTIKINTDNRSIHELAKQTMRFRTGEAIPEEPLSARTPRSPISSPSGAAGAVGAAGSVASPSRLSAIRESGRVAKVATSARSRETLALEQARLEKGIFRFHLLLQEACPYGVESSRVPELGLANAGLMWVDFAPFASLTKLLISRNQLTSLAHAGLETLKNLRVLDAHHNKLTDLREVIEICNYLPTLEFITFFKNPFQVFDPAAHAAEKAHRAASIDAGDGQSLASPSSAGSAARSSPSPAPSSQSTALFSPEKYRLTLIGHLLQLQSPTRCLAYLDHQQISEDEVIRGLKHLGQTATQREMFRFSSLTFGKDGADPAFQTLDLSNRKLKCADFSRFPHLTMLNISRNLYDDDTFAESRLSACTALTELDISGNMLKSMSRLAQLLSTLPALRMLKVSHNPGYSKSGDSERARRNFLAAFETIHMTSFQIVFLNQIKITIDERVEAMRHARQHWQTLRSPVKRHSVDMLTPPAILTPGDGPEEAGRPVTPTTPNPHSPSPQPMSPSGAISPAQMLAQGGVPMNREEDLFTQMENARFILTLHELGVTGIVTEMHLRNKNLRLLGGLSFGIASYERLVSIDLRENHLSNLRESGIDLLPKLQTLDLRMNDFPSLDALVASLRGCDALRHLRLQGATKDRDETSMPANYTPRVFADLRGLKTCDELEHAGAIENDPFRHSAQQLLWKLAKIGPNNLKRVDLSNRHLPSGLFYEILSPLYYLGIQELLAGGNNEWTLHPQYSDVIILLMDPTFKWLDGVEINDHRRLLAFRADKHGNQSGKITGNTVVWEDHHEEVHAHVDAWLKSESARKGGGADGDDPDDVKLVKGEHDLRLDLPNTMSLTTSSTTTISTVMSKIDIVIRYIQVYGMALIMDLNIPYPQAFKDFSTWIRLSTLDLSSLWDLDAAYKQIILFSFIMAVPALFVGLYFYFDRMRGRQDEWADSYVTRWNMVKWRTFGLWFFMICMSTMCSFVFIDNYATIDRFKAGEQPTPASLTWALIFFFVLVIWYFCWFRVVRLFQRHWQLDQTEHKQEFKQKWLNLIHWIQIFILFAITALYLPVARVILMQFACDKTNAAVDTSLVYPGDECFPDYVSGVHIASFVFIILYIICLPIFLVRLIREGIATVMELSTIHEILGKECDALVVEIKQIKQARRLATPMEKETPKKFHARLCIFDRNIEELETQIAKKRRAQEKEYFGRINDPVRKLASTSLYAAYEYRWRYWKIIQLVESLALVCISLFVPVDLGAVSQGRLILGTAVIGASLIFSAYVRPYFSRPENFMEILAGTANTITVLVSLGLAYDVSWLTTTRSNAILLAANVTTVVAFFIAIVLMPCQTWRRSRQVARNAKEAEQRLKNLNEANQREAEKKKSNKKKGNDKKHQSVEANGKEHAIEMNQVPVTVK